MTLLSPASLHRDGRLLSFQTLSRRQGRHQLPFVARSAPHPAPDPRPSPPSKPIQPKDWNPLNLISSSVPLLGMGALSLQLGKPFEQSEEGHGLSGMSHNDGDPLSVVKAIGILAIVVAVHECGHFFAARIQNIHVDKFALGFGPPLIRYQGEAVEYSIRAFPLGGFVAFPDDDPFSRYDDDDPDLLRNRPIKDRAWVISAGVIANVIFAFVILLVQASTVGIQTEELKPGLRIPQVLKSKPGDQAGLKAGDIILAVDNQRIAPDVSAIKQTVEAIDAHRGREMTFKIDRRGEELLIKATPSIGPNGIGYLGLQLTPNIVVTSRVARNAVESLSLASTAFVELNQELLQGLRELILNFSQNADRVSGPVAVVAIGSKIVQLDAPQMYVFAASVNLNLAVVNTLPLPALDGGYFALLVLETIRGGKKLPRKVEQGVMFSGFVALTILGCVLLVRDVEHLL